MLVAGDALGNGAGLVGLGGPDAVLARAVAELDQVAAGQADVRDAALAGGINDVGRARPQADLVAQFTQLGHGACHVVRPVLDGGYDQIAAGLQGGTSHVFLPGAERQFVDAVRRGHAGLAETGLHAGQVLQLQHHVLENVRGPGAFAQAQQETAWFPHAAAVFRQAGQHGGQTLVESGNGVGRVVFQLADIDPSFDHRTVGPDVGTAQMGNPQELNVFRCHESKQVWQSSAAGGILVCMN